ncbi:hypothetical protein ACFE04_004448 [Oxalis oulophora]
MTSYSPLAKIKPEGGVMDSIQEIAIYLHRFHNLDLFQQGWYQIKITMGWEDGGITSLGIPARVVQYEAPDLGSDDIHGVWRIDDKDNSFLTQPFRIKYAKQDVLLSVMIAFNLSLSQFQGPSTTPVSINFELLFAPITEKRSKLQEVLAACPASVHQFRIPPKALLGLHSYCPVHFDAFHTVLVDASIHVSLMKSDYLTSPQVPRGSGTAEDTIAEAIAKSNKAQNLMLSVDMKQMMPVKALLDARNLLLEDLKKLSKGVGRAIDLTDFMLKVNDVTLLHSIVQASLGAGSNAEVSGQGKPQNGLEKQKSNLPLDFRRSGLVGNLAPDDLLDIYNFLGDQVLHLWNTFLKFHRDNRTKVLEFLRDTWAKDRRAEWSIWMVYTKVEMPHHYIHSGSDESSHHGKHKRVSSLWKLPDDPAQTAATRAELHRRSIAQMKINSRSIQDMYIFGDPSRIPIMIVERVMNAPRRTLSENSYLRNIDCMNLRSSDIVGKRLGVSIPHQKSRDLKIVVFVHGFQGHHLDLRLVRNQWLLIDPKIEFLMSEANEEKTSGDFREMGHRLAQEVILFVKKKMDKVSSRSAKLRDIKLSFVGHSIGNVIIRTALADMIMEPFLKYLYTYVSVSGPHLGYLYSSNSLFNSGLWLLKKLKNTQCIHQLTFTDDPDLHNTFFYKLCKQKSLANFKNIILLSSPQDGYVPYHSARIEFCPAASRDYTKRGKVFLEMLNNCMDQIRSSSPGHRLFMRCDVNFDTSLYGKNLNSFIGRAAHIEFLESDIFARFLMWSFPEVFR